MIKPSKDETGDLLSRCQVEAVAAPLDVHHLAGALARPMN
jgi:hypothetical protein